MFVDTGSVQKVGMGQIHQMKIGEKRGYCVSMCTGEMAHSSNTIVWAGERG